MRNIGYSTGSVARADFQWAVRILSRVPVHAIELSALRFNELDVLLEALDGLELGGFRYISFHAPSKFPREKETEVVGKLSQLKKYGWPIIVHPDVIRDYSLWQTLGEQVCIENMDQRKPFGQTALHLTEIFKKLPNATLCFDIAHAKQIDSTMCEAAAILKAHQSRLKQIHMSELDIYGGHHPVNRWALMSFAKVCGSIADNIPIILESPSIDSDQEEVIQDAVRREIANANKAFA